MPKKYSGPTATLSRKFKLAIIESRLAGRRLYQIAHEAGVTPPVLSGIVHGAVPIVRGDPRVTRIGAVLGLKPAQCFSRKAIAA